MDIASQHFTFQVKLTMLPLVFGMKMSGFMLPVEHSNHDSKEYGYDRHSMIIADYSTPRVE
jgi:hypothetical protein